MALSASGFHVRDGAKARVVIFLGLRQGLCA